MINKKQLLIFWAVFFIYILGTFSMSGQTNWTFVGINANSTYFYVDDNNKKYKSNGNILVWEKDILQDGTYYVVLAEWNCSKEMKKVVQGVKYNSRGSVIARLNTSPIYYIVPNSAEAAMLRVICNNKTDSDTNSATESKSFAQIIVRNANLMSGSKSNSKIIRKVTHGEKLILVSEERVGVWYVVYDPKTESEGWLNGNTFRIVKPEKPVKKGRKRKKRL